MKLWGVPPDAAALTAALVASGGGSQPGPTTTVTTTVHAGAAQQQQLDEQKAAIESRESTVAARESAGPSTEAAANANTIRRDGTFRVGIDIQPGTYSTDGPNPGSLFCSWSRLNSFDSSNLGNIIPDGNDMGPAFVTIGPDDIAFKRDYSQSSKEIS